MPILTILCVLLCIDRCILSAAATNRPRPTTCEEEFSNYTGLLQTEFNDVVYEFSSEAASWTKANKTCGERGGQLLRALNCDINAALRDMLEAKNRKAEAWWVGQSIMGKYEKNPFNASVMNTSNKTSHYCSFLIMDPFKVATTQFCNVSLSYICQLDLKNSTELNGTINTQERTIYRAKRNAAEQADIEQRLNTMETKLNAELSSFLEEATSLLDRIETMEVGPSHDQRMEYLTLLSDATDKPNFKEVLKQNELHRQTLINCTGGILSYTVTLCNSGTGGHVDQYEEMFSKVVVIFLSINSLSTLGGGQSGPTIITTPTATIHANSFDPDNMSNLEFGSKNDGVFFKFPSSSSLGFLAKYTSVNVEMYSFKVNPLIGDSDEPISGEVAKLDLTSKDGKIAVQDLPEPFEIYLPRKDASKPPTLQVELDNLMAIITSFNVSDPDTTVVITMKPNKNVTFRVLLGEGSPPNDTNYWKETGLTFQDNYRWLVTPELRSGLNGTWFVNASLNSTWSEGLQVEVTTFLTKCMFWNSTQGSWSTYGCWVGPNTEPELTQCLCNHLTFFGSSFFIAPTYVDLSRISEYFATVSENYVVVVLLSCFFGLYLITLLWACYADRQASRKRKMTLLEDNHPCANYNYILNVQTGLRSGAGTSAMVSIVLQGADGESDPHHLSDPDKPVFERGGVDMFLLSTPFSLGDLQSIRLWHDNSGGHPNWYLNKVTIQDQQTRKVWHFLCSSWLSSNKGEGLIKRTFTPAKKNELTSFSNIFQTRTSSGFRDEHIWVSIVDPPRRSPFTRAQRVSCCMSLLLCSMAINIMFWKTPVDEDSPVIIQIGSLKITWAEVIIGVESGLLMFPINILIITIFRSIRPRLLPRKAPHSGTEYQKASAVTMPTLLKETEDVLNILMKSPKNQLAPVERKIQVSADLAGALDSIHAVIHVMQGETEPDSHWVHCSHFVLYSLAHLWQSMEQVGEGAFSCREEFQCVRSMVDLLQKKTEMVAMSHTVQRPVVIGQKKKKSQSSFWLPWWFVFVGWFLLFSISGISTFFTLLYGFVYGKEMSIQWVISLGLSLFQSIFVLQPLKVVAVAIFFALILKRVSVEESEEVEILLKEQKRRCQLYSGKAVS